MTNPLLEKKILDQVNKLAERQQKQVLEYARALASGSQVGVPGKELLTFVGAIEADDLKRIGKAVEEGCEKVNLNEW